MTQRHHVYKGKCTGTTKAGQPCRHILVCANGLCPQHGGTTPESIDDYIPAARELALHMKARLQARVERAARRRRRVLRRLEWAQKRREEGR